MHPQTFQYVKEPLADLFNLGGKELVSLVGAGGKTSLMFALAGELCQAGQRVIITTTTHILEPQGELILADDIDVLSARLAGFPVPGEWVSLGRRTVESPEGLKVKGLSPEIIDRLWLDSLAEYILVEADGSKKRPLKAPREHEPVIPRETTVVVGVMGLSGLLYPLGQSNVFGLAEFAGITGLRPGDMIGPQALADLVIHEQGLFKSAPSDALRILFLNQADLPGTRDQGLELIKTLARAGWPARVVMGSLATGIMEVFELGS